MTATHSISVDKKWTAKIWVPKDNSRALVSHKKTIYYPKWMVIQGKGNLTTFSNEEVSADEEDEEEYDFDGDSEDLEELNQEWGFSWGLELEITFFRLVTVYVWQTFIPRF